MREKIGKLCENKTIEMLALLYVLGVIFYICFVTRFTIPVHLGMDEDLHLNMAKNFHFHGGFMRNFQYVNYSSVIYSMMISVFYNFYSPERILVIIRCFNVFLMCSSIFPTYLIARRFSSKTKSLLVCLFTLMIPEMVDMGYIMQENLYFPLVLWTMYFALKSFENVACFDKWKVIASVLMGVLYFVKSCALPFIVPYVMIVCAFTFLETRSKKRTFVVSILCALIWLIVFELGKFGIDFANGFNEASNHYNSTLQTLFPVTFKTIYCFFSGMFHYVMMFALCVGVIPVVLPLINFKKSSLVKKMFLSFTILLLLAMFAEIVISMHLTDEKEFWIPHKYLFRYVAPLGVPLVICLLDGCDKITKTKAIISIGSTVVVGLYLALYGYFVPTAESAMIDSNINLIIERIGRYVIPGFAVIVGVLLMLAGIVFGCIYLHKLNKGCDVLPIDNLYFKLAFAGMVGLICVNMVLHPFYNGTFLNGKNRQEDFIKFAHYINEQDTVVYYVADKADYGMTFSSYIIQNTKHVCPDDTEEIFGREDSPYIITEIDNEIDFSDHGYKKVGDYNTINLWEK